MGFYVSIFVRVCLPEFFSDSVTRKFLGCLSMFRSLQIVQVDMGENEPWKPQELGGRKAKWIPKGKDVSFLCDESVKKFVDENPHARVFISS